MKVKAIISFNDLTENVERNIGDVFECTLERAEFLKKHNAVEFIVEEKQEETIEPVEPVEPEQEIVKDVKKKHKNKLKK